MAELILTPEEKSAPSYLDWDDEALGRAVRWGAMHLEDLKQEADDSGKTLRGYSAVVYLIGQMIRTNAEEFELSIKGLTIGEEPIGDFKLKMRRS